MVWLFTRAVAVSGGLRDGARQGATSCLGGEPAELLLVLHKLDLLVAAGKLIGYMFVIHGVHAVID